MYILIDSNNLAWIAHHSTGDLSNNEKRVGVIYGFMRFIYQYTELFESNKFIFLFDSRASKRKKIYPKYKEKRRKKLTSDEYLDRKICFEQITDLRLSVLPKLGFRNVYWQPGYEADDLIAYFANKLYGNNIFISLN